jgi:Family of unknown function (DUF6994)
VPYNAATALTLGIAVLCGYAAMFVLLFVVAALLMKAVSSKTTPATPQGSAHTRHSPGSARQSARSPAHSAQSSRASTRYATRPTGTPSAIVESIRRHHRDAWSPLADVLARYRDFFAAFGDFRGYVDFWLLQDMVIDDYSAIRFFTPFDEFRPPAIPRDLHTYRRTGGAALSSSKHVTAG